MCVSLFRPIFVTPSLAVWNWKATWSGQWQLGIFELQNSGKLNLGGGLEQEKNRLMLLGTGILIILKPFQFNLPRIS